MYTGNSLDCFRTQKGLISAIHALNFLLCYEREVVNNKQGNVSIFSYLNNTKRLYAFPTCLDFYHVMFRSEFSTRVGIKRILDRLRASTEGLSYRQLASHTGFFVIYNFL